MIVGTALLASLFLLVKAVVAQQLGLRDYLIYLLFAGYHVATAYYAESRLAFRDVRPHTAPYIWAPVAASVALLWPCLLVAVVEPSYKFIANVRSNVKYSRHEDIAKMEWRELTRACLFNAVLAVLCYL